MLNAWWKTLGASQRRYTTRLQRKLGVDLVYWTSQLDVFNDISLSTKEMEASLQRLGKLSNEGIPHLTSETVESSHLSHVSASGSRTSARKWPAEAVYPKWFTTPYNLYEVLTFGVTTLEGAK